MQEVRASLYNLNCGFKVTIIYTRGFSLNISRNKIGKYVQMKKLQDFETADSNSVERKYVY